MRGAEVGVYYRNRSVGGYEKMADRLDFGTPQNVGLQALEARKDLYCW